METQRQSAEAGSDRAASETASESAVISSFKVHPFFTRVPF
jgi:hypothetical protein